MRSVGVNDLKSHLNDYLELVKNGEVIFVTDHNQVVAEIKQPPEAIPVRNEKKQKIDAYLDKLKKEGKLKKAIHPHSLIDSIKPGGNIITSYRWKSIYSKQREDRF